MNRNNLLLFTCALAFCSCNNIDKFIDKHASQNDLDTTIDFNTRSEYTLSVKALSFEEAGMSGIPIEIYLEDPYSEDGTRGSVKPIYTGYTEDNGSLSTTITIPKGIKSIFVFSPFAGCPMEEVNIDNLDSQINLFMNVITRANIASRASNPIVIRDTKSLGISAANNINLYSFYDNNELNEWGIPQPNGSLISNGVYDKGLYTLINKTYPENVENHSDKEYWKKNTDLVIESESGTEIWVAFSGDGGFADRKVHNSVAYYTYPSDDNLNNYSDAQIKALHKTIIFPSVQDDKGKEDLKADQILPHGRKVKLMYFDEKTQKYTTVFPKGLRLGFMFIQQGFNKTFDNPFANKGYRKDIDDLTKLRFTTAEFNKACGIKGTKGENDPFFGDGISRGIARTIEYGDKKYNIVGMDYTYGTNQNGNDKDLNDALLIVESSPYIRPNDVVPPPEPENKVNYSYSYGTLAFEDSWPVRGDYDFNDFVVDYQYGIGKAENYRWDDAGRKYIYTPGNNISELTMIFKPRAIGANNINGFAVELPVLESNIDKDKLKLPDGVVLESGHENAVFVIYDNVRKCVGYRQGFINTINEEEKINSSTLSLTIPLKNYIEDKNGILNVDKINPFLFTGNRSHEIHLVDKKPTMDATFSLFGIADDKSCKEKGIFYRMDNKFPWVLDIARKNENCVWYYPIERANITLGYPKYNDWEKHKDLDWWNEDKNRDEQYLFMK